MKVEEKNNPDIREIKNNNQEESKKDLEKNEIQEGKNNLKKENKEDLNEKKIKEQEEKILRTLAEMENQRRRFDKEREEAFEFGGFSFAKDSLALIDNLERAKTSFINNKKFKENKDFDKMLEAFDILE